MAFNIHELDEIEYDGTSETEEALEEYQDSLIEKFSISPEGKKHQKKYSETGFWIAQLIYYGIGYIGVTIPQMEKSDIVEIVTDLFPKKISLSSPDDANDAIPELIAFWNYIAREFKLPNAEKIISYLHEIEPDFKSIMNDTSRFGMAKSLMQIGQSAGFDMTDSKEFKKFTQTYNEGLLSAQQEDPLFDRAPLIKKSYSNNYLPSAKRNKKKKARKIKKASRKKNRKK